MSVRSDLICSSRLVSAFWAASSVGSVRREEVVKPVRLWSDWDLASGAGVAGFGLDTVGLFLSDLFPSAALTVWASVLGV